MRVRSHDELKLGKAKQFRSEEGHLVESWANVEQPDNH